MIKFLFPRTMGLKFSLFTLLMFTKILLRNIEYLDGELHPFLDAFFQLPFFFFLLNTWKREKLRWDSVTASIIMEKLGWSILLCLHDDVVGLSHLSFSL